MKKLLLSMAVVAVAFTGCKKEESATAYDGLTADITVAPSVKETAKKDAVDVNRNDIPVYVETINVATLNTEGNGNGTTTDFSLVDKGGADKFLIKDVPYGNTEIEATTTSNTNTFKDFKPFEETLPTIYAIYTGKTTAHVNNKTAPVNIDMTTNNGRIIVKMEATQELLAKDLDVRVTNGTNATTLDANGKLKFAWQGTDAIGGAATTLKFEWFTKKDGTVQSTKTIDLKVVAGVSKTVNITLNQVGIAKIASTELTFNFVKITDATENIDLGGVSAVINPTLVKYANNKSVDPNTGFVSGTANNHAVSAVVPSSKIIKNTLLKDANFTFEADFTKTPYVNVYLADGTAWNAKKYNLIIYSNQDFIDAKNGKEMRVRIGSGSSATYENMVVSDLIVRNDYFEWSAGGSVNFVLRLGGSGYNGTDAFTIKDYSFSIN